MDEVQQAPPVTPPTQPEALHQALPPRKLPLRLMFVSIGILLVGVFSWVGYQYVATKQEKAPEKVEPSFDGTITVGYTSWPGYVGLYTAREKGLFKQAGLTVVLKKFDGFTQLSQAYAANEIQAKADVMLDTVSDAYDGVENKVVIAVDYSNGSDGIIGTKSITSFAQIKGKKVAFEHGKLGEFFLLYALEQHQMTLEDIIPVDLDAEKAAIALVKGEVDVTVTYEPFLSKATEQVQTTTLYTSAEVPGLITDIIEFRSDFVEKYPDSVQAFVKVYFQGIKFWKENSQEVNSILAKELETTPEDAVVQLAGITVLDQQENLIAFTYAAGLQSLYGNLKNVNKFVRSQRLDNSEEIDTDTLIDPRFVKALESK